MGKKKSKKVDPDAGLRLEWTNGKKARETREARHARHARTRVWMMRYDLAYDGGGSAFDQYYRTRLGAHWSAFWHLHFRSWGGSAKLYYVSKNSTDDGML